MSCDTLKKKEKKKFQLLSSQAHMGFRAVWVDRTKQGQLLWVASYCG